MYAWISDGRRMACFHKIYVSVIQDRQVVGFCGNWIETNSCKYHIASTLSINLNFIISFTNP